MMQFFVTNSGRMLRPDNAITACGGAYNAK